MLYAAKIDVEDGSSSFKLIIDGLEIAESAVPPWLAVEANPDEITVDPPLGYKWVNSGSIWRNTDSQNHRIEIKAETDNFLMFAFDNPTIIDFDKQHVGVCLASVESTEPENPNNTYTLTLDDKGIYPSDNIYSGKISPPNSSLSLFLRIQWFSSMDDTAHNGRIFYVDADHMQLSENGSRWSVNINTLPSYLLPSHMDQSGFYQFLISQNYGLNDPSFEIISDEIYYPYSPR